MTLKKKTIMITNCRSMSKKVSFEDLLIVATCLQIRIKWGITVMHAICYFGKFNISNSTWKIIVYSNSQPRSKVWKATDTNYVIVSI